MINCSTASAVRTLLAQCGNLIMSSDPPLSMEEPWHINPSWTIPISIKSVLMSLQRGFLQDFAYICIAKAKDSASKQVMFRISTISIVLRKKIMKNVPFHIRSSRWH